MDAIGEGPDAGQTILHLRRAGGDPRTAPRAQAVDLQVQGQTTDLAKQNPAKLKGMQDLFRKEAEKYFVLPIDDRSIERVNAALVGRPDLMAGRTSLTVFEGMTGMSENVFINTKNHSHTIAAKPSVPAGKATIRYEFAYDGSGLGKGGTGTIFVNGKQVAEGRIDQTQPILFSGDEGTDVGEDGETPVIETYGMPAPYKFIGRIEKITVELLGMQKADTVEEDKALALAAHKKKLSD